MEKRAHAIITQIAHKHNIAHKHQHPHSSLAQQSRDAYAALIPEIANCQAQTPGGQLEAYQPKLPGVSDEINQSHSTADSTADKRCDAGTHEPHTQRKHKHVVKHNIEQCRNEVAPHSVARSPVQTDDEQADSTENLEKAA